MTLHRRTFLSLTAAAAGSAMAPGFARAQAYPAKPVRIIVGFAPGSSSDILSRLIGQRLQERLGQPFIVENRGGAGGNLATEAVANAAPDGYTLLNTGTWDAINATLYKKLSYSFTRDIAPVASIARGPLVFLVHPSFPAKTVPEFIAYAKANPGKVNFGSSGNGSTIHMASELFKAMAGVDLVHVPYKGSPLAQNDLLSGQIQMLFSTTPSAVGHIRSGTLRALAVTTAARAASLPDIPPIADFVPGYEASILTGFGATKGTPADVIEKLNAEVNVALADAAIKAKVVELGNEPVAMSVAGFTELLTSEVNKWAEVIKTARIEQL